MSGGYVLMVMSFLIVWVGVVALEMMGTGDKMTIAYGALALMGAVIGMGLELMNYTKDGEK